MSDCIVFEQDGDFQACYAAEAWLRARGFSIGPSQVGGPRAIWHGDCAISKWRNLSVQEKRSVHARMEGDIRNGPVSIILCALASAEACAAFALTDSDLRAATPPTDQEK